MRVSVNHMENEMQEVSNLLSVATQGCELSQEELMRVLINKPLSATLYFTTSKTYGQLCLGRAFEYGVNGWSHTGIKESDLMKFQVLRLESAVCMDPVNRAKKFLQMLETQEFCVEDCDDNLATVSVGDVAFVLEYHLDIDSEMDSTPDGFSLGRYTTISIKVNKIGLYISEGNVWDLGMMFYADKCGLFYRVVEVIEEKLFEKYNGS